jgi:5-methylcytosine-specific restriction protein A
MATKGQPFRHLYNAAWLKRRRLQLARQPLCELCLGEGLAVPARVVHHVVPHRGDALVFRTSPLQSLCEWHHNAHAREDELRGYVGGYGEDGLPLSTTHPIYRGA